MDLEAFGELLDSIPGFHNRVAYNKFPEGAFPGLPVLRYRVTDNVILCADNLVQASFPVLSIELYTANKDMEAEKKVETALNDAGLPYGKEEDTIDGEQCYVVTYTVCI